MGKRYGILLARMSHGIATGRVVLGEHFTPNPRIAMKKIACLAVCLTFLLVAQLQAGKCFTSCIELTGHCGEVQFVAFAPLGHRVVTVDEKCVRIWNAKTGRLVRMHALCDGDEFESSKKRRVTLEDKTVKIWSVKTGRLVRVLKWCDDGEEIVFASISPGGKRVVTVQTDNSVRVWKANGKPKRGLLGLEDPVDAAAVSPCGKRVVTVSGDTVRIWTL